jgi:hypothetical protein
MAVSTDVSHVNTPQHSLLALGVRSQVICVSHSALALRKRVLLAMGVAYSAPADIGLVLTAPHDLQPRECLEPRFRVCGGLLAALASSSSSAPTGTSTTLPLSVTLKAAGTLIAGAPSAGGRTLRQRCGGGASVFTRHSAPLCCISFTLLPCGVGHTGKHRVRSFTADNNHLWHGDHTPRSA